MDHNYSEDVALTRDTFLKSEIDYLKKLVQVPEFMELYSEYREVGVGALSDRLSTLTQMMENGQVSEKDERKVELDIMCCCLAIEDAVKSKGSKVLTPTIQEEKTNGRSR